MLSNGLGEDERGKIILDMRTPIPKAGVVGLDDLARLLPKKKLEEKWW